MTGKKENQFRAAETAADAEDAVISKRDIKKDWLPVLFYIIVFKICSFNLSKL